MTLCVGLRTARGVLFVADTAATGGGPSSQPFSTFGELHEEQRGGHVAERSLKLCQLGPRAIGAYAGNIQIGIEILRLVRHHIQQREPHHPVVALERAVAVVGNDACRAKVMVGYTEVEQPGILTYNVSEKGEIVDERATVVAFGSLPDWLIDMVRQLESFVVRPPEDNGAKLAILLAALQCLGVHHPLMQSNIGGAMVGIRVDSMGVEWMRDTSYALYRHAVPFEEQAPEWVSLVARERAVGIATTFGTKAPRILLNNVWPVDVRRWVHQHKESVLDALRANQMRYYVLMSRDYPVVTVFYVLNPERDDRIRTWRTSDETTFLRVRTELLPMLYRKLDRSQDLLDIIYGGLPGSELPRSV